MTGIVVNFQHSQFLGHYSVVLRHHCPRAAVVRPASSVCFERSKSNLGKVLANALLFSNQKRVQEEEEELDCYETGGSMDQSFPMT